MAELKAAMEYWFGVRLSDCTNRPEPRKAVAYSDLVVYFRPDGNASSVQKTMNTLLILPAGPEHFWLVCFMKLSAQGIY